MKTGDIVTDSRAQAWTLGTLLGEGAWGRSWLVRDDDARQRVLKVPFEAGELPPAQEGRAAQMRECAKEQADLMVSDMHHLPPLEDRIILPSGGVALLMPHFPSSLDGQLGSGLPLTEVLLILDAVCASLAKSKTTHGNLRPSNILLDPAGDPLLADLCTESTPALLGPAIRSQPARKRWAPEDGVGVDAWAMCQIIYAAVMLEEGDGSLPAPPEQGLDKVALAEIKDRAVARLRRDGANPRFINRTADRLAALLARGLSAQSDPSPPYRFETSIDFEPRLREVVSLIRPSIANVGKLLLASSAMGDVFHGPGPVGFSVSVSPSEGVTESDDLVCGVRLTDLDAPAGEDGRISLEDAQFAVDKHPSGRFRFEFNLPNVEPGRYGVRVAFSIKDSGDDPAVVEGRFQVRPPPGYVPPPQPDQGPAPIALNPLQPSPPRPDDFDDDEEEDDAPTVLMSRSEIDEEALMAEVVEAFPRPLAPSSPGASFEPEVRPEPPAPVPTPRPVLEAVPTPPPSTAPSEYPDEPSVPEANVTIAPPQLAAPVPTPPPAPSAINPHQDWQPSQAHEADFFNPDEAALPGVGQDDLMGDAAGPQGSGVLDQFKELVQRDTPTSMLVAVVACILVVALLMAILRSC